MFEIINEEEMRKIDGGYLELVIAAIGLGITVGQVVYDAGYALGQRDAYRIKNSA